MEYTAMQIRASSPPEDGAFYTITLYDAMIPCTHMGRISCRRCDRICQRERCEYMIVYHGV